MHGIENRLRKHFSRMPQPRWGRDKFQDTFFPRVGPLFLVQWQAPRLGRCASGYRRLLQGVRKERANPGLRYATALRLKPNRPIFCKSTRLNSTNVMYGIE